MPFIRRVLSFLKVEFLSYEDQHVADACRLNTFWDRVPLKVTYDDGTSVRNRDQSCMRLDTFKEKFILVKQPLGSGKSYQARRLNFNRVC